MDAMSMNQSFETVQMALNIPSPAPSWVVAGKCEGKPRSGGSFVDLNQ